MDYKLTNIMDSKFRRENSNFKFNSITTFPDVDPEATVMLTPPWICDPNSEKPDEIVPGLLKIFPKNLEPCDFLGMVIDSGLDNGIEHQDSYYSTMINVVEQEYTNFVGKNYYRLWTPMTYGQDPGLFATQGRIYIPESGYFGDSRLMTKNVLAPVKVHSDGTSQDPIPVTDLPIAMTPDEIRDFLTLTDGFVYITINNDEGWELDIDSSFTDGICLFSESAGCTVWIYDDKRFAFAVDPAGDYTVSLFIWE